jgi:putative NIF3 family GTP cyclohydrolase 1 type 2
LDAFLTGEPAEHAMADAREGGLHFIAAGHYATETLGVRALAARVGERFDIAWDFVDLPNPV